MKKVIINMSGDEFKQLVEGGEPNGEINTIPEVMAAMQGVPDDGTTIKQEIKEETNEMLKYAVGQQNYNNY